MHVSHAPATTLEVDDLTGQRHSPLRVFLVDDHELIRRGLRDLLSVCPDLSVVGESGSALSATSEILAMRPDVVLLDVRLPDGCGIEVCRDIRAQNPAIRILVVTTFDDPDIREAALLAGASGFVLKQIHGDELLSTVRRVAAGDDIPDTAVCEAAARLQGDPRLASLTGQEARILDLIVEGLTNSQIAERLGIGTTTVRNYVTNLLAKLGVESRTQAAVYALTHGRHQVPRAQ